MLIIVTRKESENKSAKEEARCYCDECGHEIRPLTDAKLLLCKTATVCRRCALHLNAPVGMGG